MIFKPRIGIVDAGGYLRALFTSLFTFMGFISFALFYLIGIKVICECFSFTATVTPQDQ